MRHEQVDVGAWRHLAESFHDFSPFPDFEPSAITVPMWYAALRKKSPRTGPGPDRLSRRDCWQCRSSSRRKSSLYSDRPRPKGSGRNSSSQGSSPRWQRHWGRLRSCVIGPYVSFRCVTAHGHLCAAKLSATLPNMPLQVFWATCQEPGASDSWYSILLQIEGAYRQGTELCGVAVDLVKAYNMLPRLPVAAFAKMCGIPDSILHPWMSMLTQLRRHFKVRGSTGPPLFSSTGYAEGDPLSCLAMAVLNVACHHSFRTATQGGQLLSFVDNWHALAASPQEIVAAHNAIADFAQAWDLPVDAEKTVVWCTSAKGRAALRQAGFSVTLDFRELGAHLSSSRRGTNFTLTDRIRALDDKWPRLEKSLAPFAHKVRALSTAAWPAALHGVSSSRLGERHFIQLRSKAMKALGLRAPGANPTIQLSLVGHAISDPQFFALQSTFRDAKFLARHYAVAPLLNAAAAETRKVPGPCTLLLQRANEVGIAWDPDREVFIDPLGDFDLWQLSWPEILQRLVFTWQDWVQQRLSCRPTFEGLDRADPHLTNAVVGKLPSPARALVRLSLNGTFFTNNALKHVGQADHSSCDFCGQPDFIRHRLMECPYFRDCRRECQLTVEELESLPPAQLLHGWAMKPDSLGKVRESLAALPLSLDSFHPFPCLAEYHVFVDGSCLRPGVPHLRLASWATLLATPGFEEPLLLSDGLVPGLLQSAFRAELCATVSALLFCVLVQRRVWVWSDCLGVVRRVRRFLEGSWVPGERSRHFDLWKILLPHQETLAKFSSVCKVVSPQEPDLELSMGDEWCAHFNNLVDVSAARAQNSRGEEFWATRSQLCREWEREHFVASEIVALHVRVGHLATRSRVSRTDMVLQHLPLPDWTGSLGTLSDADSRFLARKYGERYVQDLTTWAALLNVEGAPVRWISSIQLFFSFCLRFRRPPVFRGNRWRDLDTLENGRLVHIPTPSWVHFFLRHVRDYANKARSTWRLRECRPHSTALCIKVSSVPLRFDEQLWQATEVFLSRNLPRQAIAGHDRGWRSIPPP